MLPPNTTFLSQPPLHFLHHHKPPSLSVTTTTKDTGIEFHRKLLYIESLNINSLKALKQNPNLNSTPIQTLISVEKCLLSIGLPRSSLGRIFDMFPQILTFHIHQFYPLFDFLLNDVALSYPNLSKSIIRCPRLLISSVDSQLKPNLMFLRKLGFVGRRKIDWHTTVLLVSSVENTLIPKIGFLSGLGFTDSEVRVMVVRSPALLTYSVEKNLRPKFEYFVGEMKGDVRDIKRFPQFFSFSLDGRIKPRHRLLIEYGVSMGLSDMLKLSDGEFNVWVLELRLMMLNGGRDPL